MPKRNPKRDEAFEIWKKHKGEITNKAIAEQVDAPAKTISAWKSRDKWTASLKTNECSTTKKKRSTTRKELKKEPVIESDNLTEKQRLFCIYFNKYLNATKAYQKVYECDYATAQSIAYRMMGNDGIKKEITRLRKERAANLFIETEDIIQKYIDIAFADISDYVEIEGGYSVAIKPLDQMDTSIISELSNTENGAKLKLADKMKALEMLAKYTDLLSNNDKKRLQEEKLKVENAKLSAELEYLQGDSDDDSHERMQQYLKAVGTDSVESIFEDGGDADAKD